MVSPSELISSTKIDGIGIKNEDNNVAKAAR